MVTTLFLSACQEESHVISGIEGTYEGHFIRSSPTAKYQPSKVILTLSNGEFRGESERTKYPAICNGTYEVKGNKVEFSNACVWTAEFDWTLILSGEFSAELASDELTLQRNIGSIWDLYELKRQ